MTSGEGNVTPAQISFQILLWSLSQWVEQGSGEGRAQL